MTATDPGQYGGGAGPRRRGRRAVAWILGVLALLFLLLILTNPVTHIVPGSDSTSTTTATVAGPGATYNVTSTVTAGGSTSTVTTTLPGTTTTLPGATGTATITLTPSPHGPPDGGGGSTAGGAGPTRVTGALLLVTLAGWLTVIAVRRRSARPPRDRR